MADIKEKVKVETQEAETTNANVFVSKSGLRIPRKSDYKPGALKLGIDKEILEDNSDIEHRWVNEGEDGNSGIHEALQQGWIKPPADYLQGAATVRQATGAEKCHLMLKPKEDYEKHRKIKMQSTGLTPSDEEKTIPKIDENSFQQDDGMSTAIVRKGKTVITDSNNYQSSG